MKYLKVKPTSSLHAQLVMVDDIIEVESSKWGVTLTLRNRSKPLCIDEAVHGPGKEHDIMRIMGGLIVGGNIRVTDEEKELSDDVAF